MNWKKVKNGLKTAGKIFGISILNSMITFSSNLEENRHRTDYVDRLPKISRKSIKDLSKHKEYFSFVLFFVVLIKEYLESFISEPLIFKISRFNY